jgi:chorismate synthase
LLAGGKHLARGGEALEVAQRREERALLLLERRDLAGERFLLASRPRAVPLVEAMTELVLADHALRHHAQCE